MTDPDEYTASIREHVATRLRVGVTTHLDDMRYLRDTMTADVRRDYTVDRAVMHIRGYVLTEQLPTQTARDVWSGNHVFELDIAQPDPRWATWWDQWKDTYRHRWWAAWWIRHHPPRYTTTTVRLRDTHVRSCRHELAVDVRDHWVYPYASIVPPEFGYSVLWAVDGDDPRVTVTP